jgi:hypothetical protein
MFRKTGDPVIQEDRLFSISQEFSRDIKYSGLSVQIFIPEFLFDEYPRPMHSGS